MFCHLVKQGGHKHIRALGPLSSGSLRTFCTSYSTSAKERVVILGSGWGGFNVLKRIDKQKYDVAMISPSSYFNMTPLLAETAVGTLEFRAAIESLRNYSPAATIHEAWADKIDLENKIVHCTPSTPPYGVVLSRHSLTSPNASAPGAPTAPQGQNPSYGTPYQVRYDKLVIAVGAYSQTFNIPGVKEYVHFLKNVRDARAIRMRILECFTQASQPNCTEAEKQKLMNFVIVGGGPTGVEFAAELHDLCQTDMRAHFPQLISYVRITVYETSDKILGTFDESLSRYATEKFKSDGIEVKSKHGVEEVKPVVPFGLCVWSTGLAANPLISSLTELRKDKRTGSLITDKKLRVVDDKTGKSLAHVWAIGDASVIEDDPLPATAQVASQKAMYLVKCLNKGKQADGFKFHFRGSLAYVGDWKAVYDRSTAESGPQTKAKGRIAWLLWRSAYFSMAMSPRNMLNIPWYWFTNWIFGRDLARF
ncbi:FAD/NAD-P-binding domain-containing protein [Cantharellus anzutake]|uniref:FAD/NAD-P-binding domain-containing protein n=1 Tax=Cantharellus anzutake TaxID=1750568 RepID=UPI001902F048|nr:FAD/NAD-P-binding domain-containing protein [Cantharellus anzutake]KAF8333046.1 FAD/NAD-P-binding domain-containing protein [Cantharellus anzutake]